MQFSLFVKSFSLSILTAMFAGCASTSTDWTKVEMDQLKEQVKGIAEKIEKDEVPRFVETGDPTIDVLVKPFVDAGTETAPQALEIAQKLESTEALTVLNRSVESAMSQDSKLTEEQATEQVVAKMSPQDRDKLNSFWASQARAVKQYEGNSADWIAKSIPLLADLAMKVKAAAQGGMMAAITGAKAAVAINDGIEQVNGIIEFVAPANELIRRSNVRLETVKKYNEMNLRNR